MNILRWFKNWKEEEEEKKSFLEAWDEEFGTEIGSSNSCKSYHKKIAYEIFCIRRDLEALKDKK